MRYTRAWTDEAGESHLEELPINYKDVEDYAVGVPVVHVSEPLKANLVHFVRFPVGWVGDWHPTPTKQKWILLEGRLGGITSYGTEIFAEPGDCGLLEDTHGKGHRSWVVGEEPALVVMVTLE